ALSQENHTSKFIQFPMALPHFSIFHFHLTLKPVSPGHAFAQKYPFHPLFFSQKTIDSTGNLTDQSWRLKLDLETADSFFIFHTHKTSVLSLFFSLIFIYIR